MKKALGVILYSIGAVGLVVSNLVFFSSVVLWVLSITGILTVAFPSLFLLKILGTFIAAFVLAVIGSILIQE